MTNVAVDVPELFRRALAPPHRFDAELQLLLKQAARERPAALLAEITRLTAATDAARYPSWVLVRHVEHTISTTPGIEQAEAALRLAIRPAAASLDRLGPYFLDEDARRRWIVARLAIRQPPDVALELLERNEERSEFAPLLPLLTAELLTRGRVRPADHAVVGRLLREMRGTGSPFAWLPHEPLPIEGSAIFPALGEELFTPAQRLPPIETTLRPLQFPWGSGTLVEFPDVPRPEGWPRDGTQLELRAFHLPPSGERADDASALSGLPLESLRPNPSLIQTQPVEPEGAFALLFQLGVVDEGWVSGSAAWPRLVAWRLLAALAGRPATSAPEEIERAARELTWTRAAVRGGWFDQVDVGWAFLMLSRDASRRDVRVLAATRVEPRT